MVRQTEHFLGVQFNLAASVERDLLIRKLFTAGLDTTNVSASVWSATGAMFKSIWQVRAETPELDAVNVGDALGHLCCEVAVAKPSHCAATSYNTPVGP